MDYEHKYKDALEKARKFRDDYIVDDPMMSDFDSIFPELAESEDERIRKVLIRFFNNRLTCVEDDWFGLKCKDIIAWLEKQKEWKPSKEQMDELFNAIIPGNEFDCDVLKTLYNDLKKLMEE